MCRGNPCYTIPLALARLPPIPQPEDPLRHLWGFLLDPPPPPVGKLSYLPCSDEEDEVWIRRPSLPRAGRSPPAQAVEDPQPHPPRQDPWSQRMRSKYGLDVDQFSYDPTQGDQQAPTLPEPMPEEKGRRCSIM